MYTIPRSSRRSGHLHWRTGAVAAIALLVCMVSLPRLENYVQSNNEEDAAVALRALGRAGDPGDAPDLSTWIAGVRGLSHRFRDARRLEGSGLLLHHGYLFLMQRTGSGQTRFMAWPRSTPRTGRAAFLLDATGGLHRHPNVDGHWSGPDAKPFGPGMALAERGWQSYAPARRP